MLQWIGTLFIASYTTNLNDNNLIDCLESTLCIVSQHNMTPSALFLHLGFVTGDN